MFPLPEGAAVDHPDDARGRARDRGRDQGARRGQAPLRGSAKSTASGRRWSNPSGRTSSPPSVANIGPNDAITVVIEYQEAVRYERGRFSLRFPMVVGPRYAARERVARRCGATYGQPVPMPAVTTARAVGAERLYDPQPGQPRVDLDAGVPLSRALRAVSQARGGGSGARGVHRIALAEGVVPADRDFELVWQPTARHDAADGRVPRGARRQALRAGDAAATGRRVRARRACRARRSSSSTRRDRCRALDRPGARRARSRACPALRRPDRFNVIEFNSNASARCARRRCRPRPRISSRRAVGWRG